MKVQTLTDLEIDLKQTTLDDLKIRLQGQVLLSGDTGYEQAKTVWNAMIDRKPAIVVRSAKPLPVSMASIPIRGSGSPVSRSRAGSENITWLARSNTE